MYDVYYYYDKTMKRRDKGFDPNVDGTRIHKKLERAAKEDRTVKVIYASAKTLGSDDIYYYDGDFHVQPPPEARAD